MLAGSLRLMELVQNQFEAEGVSHTTLAGVSWGGITSLLYEGLFQRTDRVISMLASPNIARTIWDIADLFQRPLPVSYEELATYLDFSAYYRQSNHHVYPLLGEDDLFFRWQHHANLFSERPLVTVPGGHITNLWRNQALQHHLHQTLSPFIP